MERRATRTRRVRTAGWLPTHRFKETVTVKSVTVPFPGVGSTTGDEGGRGAPLREGNGMNTQPGDDLEAGKKETRGHFWAWAGLTWSEAVSISWLVTWRCAALLICLPMVIGGVLGAFNADMLREAAGIAKFQALAESINTVVIPPLLVFIFGPMVISQALRKRFKGFRLAIVRDHHSRKS